MRRPQFPGAPTPFTKWNIVPTVTFGLEKLVAWPGLASLLSNGLHINDWVGTQLARLFPWAHAVAVVALLETADVTTLTAFKNDGATCDDAVVTWI